MEGAAANSLYRNEDDRFIDVAQKAGIDEAQASFTAAWGDVDLDGYLDLYVANGVIGDGGRNNLWYNQQDGTFEDIGPIIGNSGFEQDHRHGAFGDYDGDGYLDLYAVNIGTPNRLYHNGTDGTFVDRADQAGVIFPLEGGYVTFFLDFNNDGQLDLFASTMSAFEDVLNSWVEGRAIEPNRPFLYLNNGDGTFTGYCSPGGFGPLVRLDGHWPTATSTTMVFQTSIWPMAGPKCTGSNLMPSFSIRGTVVLSKRRPPPGSAIWARDTALPLPILTPMAI